MRSPAVENTMGSRKTSRQVRRPTLVGSARAILRGELDKIGLPTLLTIVEMERRSGIFVLSHGRQLGRLHVREGRIIRASTEGPRRMRGEEAIYQMLTWAEGRFELWMAEVQGRDEIEQCTAFLLMEGMRRMDEAAREAQPDLPANDIIVAY
jgi:two-component system, OmpR family, response regulator